MRYKISYIIRLNTIDDFILKKLQDYMIELKILPKYYDFIKSKYDPFFFTEESILNSINPNDPSSDFFDYDSMEHKKLLDFFYNNNLVIDHNIINTNYAIIEYDKNDYNNCEYFILYLNFYQSSIPQKYIDINNLKFKPITLTENFIIFDNYESLICNKDIVSKIQFQEYNNGFSNIYFINKSLGNFLLVNNFTGFELFPVRHINTNEIIFYQLKVVNIIKLSEIKTEISSLFDNTEIIYPSKTSPLYDYYLKRQDICIYNQEYIENNFKDFNIFYFAFKDSSSNCSNYLTRPQLVVSKRAMLLLKQHKSKFAINPIYSTENIDINIFSLSKEIKTLINRCKKR